jgi:TPR repeat protein
LYDYEDAVANFDRGEYENALHIFMSLSENGDNRAKYYIGLMYNLGLGVERDVDKAVYWYEDSAAGNNVQAQYNLGLLNIVGINGAPDYDAAIKWLRLSAAQGYTPSFRELGWAYLKRGRDVSDLCMAIHWYDKSKDVSSISESINDLRDKLQGKCSPEFGK